MVRVPDSAERRLVLEELAVLREVQWEYLGLPLYTIFEARAQSSGDTVAKVGKGVRMTYREVK